MHTRHLRTKENYMSPFIKALLMVLIIFLFFNIGIAGAEGNVSLTYKIEASYTMGPGDSKALAHKLALFRAKRKAADQAARDFERQKLIQFKNGDHDELVALVAEKLTFSFIFDKWKSNDEHRTYSVDIQTEVKLSDFIDAQLDILKLQHKKSTDNFREEMEPAPTELLKPGRALARAYWLMRTDELRMAIIYIDGLIRQYPNWQEAYDIKKMAQKQQYQLGAPNKHRAMRRWKSWDFPFSVPL